MKKLLLALALILFIFAVADCQMVNQNTQFTKIAMFTGKPIVQDTALLIKNGSDTLRITTYADTTRFTTTAGGGFKFNQGLTLSPDRVLLRSQTGAIPPFILLGNAVEYGGAEFSGIMYADTVTIGSYLEVDGFFKILPQDSATIYATTPGAGTTANCSDCSGNGILGRIVVYMNSAWRRLVFE